MGSELRDKQRHQRYKLVSLVRVYSKGLDAVQLTMRAARTSNSSLFLSILSAVFAGNSLIT